MIASAQLDRRPAGLSEGHFRKIAVCGFGDPHNSYCYSCAWYNGHVYIGTLRDTMSLVKLRAPYEVNMPFWPVPTPETVFDLDLRAQIWRYAPEADEWDRVYRSPMIMGTEEKEVPLSVGFRNMAVFQGKSDPQPAIYTVTFSSSQGYGPQVLRSLDGEHFDAVSEPGLGLGDPNLRSFRGVLPFKGRLFATPAGSGGGNVNIAYNVVILSSDDPAKGHWEASNEHAFGDPANLTVFDMAICGDWLYAATLNVRQGFQLWKTDAEGPPPHRWQKVLDRGADRGPFNQVVLSMREFKGNLYLGTGIQGGGLDRANAIGPAASEVIRVYPDDSWDLVVGEPRLTRHGPKLPTSGLGSGFDNPFAGYFWRMCEHDGTLYLGTYDWAIFLPYTPNNDWPEGVKRMLTPDSVERMLEVRGGAELWRTHDGDHWVAVTRDGMNNRYNFGIRSLLSTPIGLIVGTANPFGPQIAVKKAGGFVYEDNPQGGLEVWLGSPDHRGGPGDQAGTLGREGRPIWLRPDGTAPDEDDAQAEDRPVSMPNNAAAGGESSMPPPRSLHGANRITHSTAGRSHAVPFKRSDDPYVRLATESASIIVPPETIDEELAEYFGDSPLRCVGFWHDESVTPRRACLDLLDELTSLVPRGDESERRGRVLAIHPQISAVAADLERLCSAADLTCWQFDPLGKKPLRFDVADGSFATILWIEGPTSCGRAKALAEASRLLKPGGRLIVAELVGSPLDEFVNSPAAAPTAKVSIESYRADLNAAGFETAEIQNVSAKTWLPFCQHSRKYFFLRQMLQLLDEDRYQAIVEALPGGRQAVDAYLFITATKHETSQEL